MTELNAKQVKAILKKNNYPVFTTTQEIVLLLEKMSEQQQDVIFEKCKSVLNNYSTNVNITFDSISQSVCKFHKVTFADVNNTVRKKDIVQIRQRIMFFCKRFNIGSLSFIAQHFVGKSNKNGLKDHATVIYAIKTIENSTFKNPKIKQELEDIEVMILNYEVKA